MPASTSQVGHLGQARNMLSSFPCWVFPIPASRPTSSGHFMCMALTPTKDTLRDVGDCVQLCTGWLKISRWMEDTLRDVINCVPLCRNSGFVKLYIFFYLKQVWHMFIFHWKYKHVDKGLYIFACFKILLKIKVRKVGATFIAICKSSLSRHGAKAIVARLHFDDF